MLTDLIPLFLLAAAEIREPWPPLWAMEWAGPILLGAWLFALGGAVGSFLNVVVYRLPRGMSLNHPASHCPKCGHAIRWRDNLPILGWLVLRGKCRDCKTEISPRYFYVEVVVASAFLLVFLCEAILARGTHSPPGIFSGRPPLTPFQTLPFWCAYATHVLLVTTLIGATLIDWDGFRTPRRLFWPILLVGLVLPLVWPEIRRIPAYPELSDVPAWRAGLIDGAAGLGTGLALGLVAGAAWWLGSRGRGWPKFAPVMLLAAVGVVFGWQRLVGFQSGSLLLFLIAVGVLRLSGAKAIIPYAPFLLVAAGIHFTELGSDGSHSVIQGNRPEVAALFVALSAVFWAIAGALASEQYFVVHIPQPANPPPANYSAESESPAPLDPPANSES